VRLNEHPGIRLPTLPDEAPAPSTSFPVGFSFTTKASSPAFNRRLPPATEPASLLIGLHLFCFRTFASTPFEQSLRIEKLPDALDWRHHGYSFVVARV
jgi:hypothetical protein